MNEADPRRRGRGKPFIGSITSVSFVAAEAVDDILKGESAIRWMGAVQRNVEAIDRDNDVVTGTTKAINITARKRCTCFIVSSCTGVNITTTKADTADFLIFHLLLLLNLWGKRIHQNIVKMALIWNIMWKNEAYCTIFNSKLTIIFKDLISHTR